MSSKVKSFLGVVERLSELFNSKPTTPQAPSGSEPAAEARPAMPKLDDLSKDDLMHERIRLEQEEKKLLGAVEQVEKEKRAVFEQATRETSARTQMIMARKIKELETKAQNIDRNLRVISQQLRIINGFIQVKENKRIWEQSGLWAQISQMDLSQLESYVGTAMVNGQFSQDKFGDIIATLEGTNGLVPDMKEDGDVLDILKEIQTAAAMRESEPGAVDEGLARVDQRLRSPEKPENL